MTEKVTSIHNKQDGDVKSQIIEFTVGVLSKHRNLFCLDSNWWVKSDCCKEIFIFGGCFIRVAAVQHTNNINEVKIPENVF